MWAFKRRFNWGYLLVGWGLECSYQELELELELLLMLIPVS